MNAAATYPHWAVVAARLLPRTAVLRLRIKRRGKKLESRSLTQVNSIGDSPLGASLIPESELLHGAHVRKTLRGKGFVSISWY